MSTPSDSGHLGAVTAAATATSTAQTRDGTHDPRDPSVAAHRVLAVAGLPGGPMKDSPRSRAIRLGILHRANCEKCAADCTATVDAWILDGKCSACRKGAQQRVA